MNIAKLIADHIPEAFVEHAIAVVRQKDATLTDATARRERAVPDIQEGLHVRENVARLLVEIAVLALKTQSGAGMTADR
jgi:hypothetical protein